jgi:hypothetical protein
MCARFACPIAIRPTPQITSIGQRLFPHWTLSGATANGARNRSAQMPKFVGFQMCRPFARRTYFDMTESTAPSAYGQSIGDRTRMEMLMPEM